MARTSILPKTKIRAFFSSLDLSEETVKFANRIRQMAISYVDVRRSTRKYGKRKQRDTGMGINKILTTPEQLRMWQYLEKNCDSVDGIKNLVMWDVLIGTGIRASELCRLRLQDTPEYLGENAIFISRSKGMGGGKDRTVWISKRLAGVISDWIEHYRWQLLPTSTRRQDKTRYLFYSYRRRKYNANAVYKKFQQMAIDAGITKDFHPHMARHTYATYQLLDGVNLGTLQGLLGHSSIKITQQYLHVAELLDSQIGERLDMRAKAFKSGVSRKIKKK